MKIEFAQLTEIGAPEIFVDGLGSIEVIGDTVRLNFYMQVGDEKRVIATTRWSLKVWQKAYLSYRHFFHAILGKSVTEIRDLGDTSQPVTIEDPPPSASFN